MARPPRDHAEFAWNTADVAVAASHGMDLGRLRVEFDELMARAAPRFARVESRRPVRDVVLGLMSGLPVTNCWTLSEHAGHDSPDGSQHLLRRAKWDTDAVRNDLRGFVVERLGGGDAVLVVDLCRDPAT
jgi:SRSO17 transposase